MRRRLAPLALLVSLSGCLPTPADPPARPVVTQVSVINALMIGRYDGVLPIDELLKRGDFGVGTLDHLDGELVVLDGRAFQVRGDGTVLPVAEDRSTPFAAVVRFRPTAESALGATRTLSDLDAGLDRRVPERNNFVALRIDGTFTHLRFRSVHRQEPPYRPLAEVAASQSEWTHANVRGTLVGLRCPPWTVGLNVPGYHWHFLSDDRTVGGHVLEAAFDSARLRHQVVANWMIELDGSPDFNAADLTPDLRKELRQVESGRETGPASRPPGS